MAERATGFDLEGAARDLDEMARRYSPIHAQPHLSECVRLLQRNPAIAGNIRKAIEAEMANLPGGGIGLDVPLFDAQGRWNRQEERA